MLGAYTPSKINEAECEPAVLEYSSIGEGEKAGELGSGSMEVQVVEPIAETQIVASA